MKQVFYCAHATARSLACKAVMEAPEGYRVTVEPPKRSNILNAKMWAVLAQLEPIDWYGFSLSRYEWKDVVTAALKGEKVVPGIDGGFVRCGQSTREMPSREIWDVIEAAYALGTSIGIRFVEPDEDLMRPAKSKPQ